MSRGSVQRDAAPARYRSDPPGAGGPLAAGALPRRRMPAMRTIALDEPIARHLRTDFPTVPRGATVEEALRSIREHGLGERIVYFYVVDEEGRLVGILPTRRILTSRPETRVDEVMVERVVAIPLHFDVLGACELFVLHRFLALPVVDAEKRIVGIVDVSLFTDEVLDLAERQRADALFENVGIRIAELRGAPPLRAFRLRIPWLLATIASGVACAILTSRFEATLAQSLVLAFFMTLVLGLGESVGMQSMTVTIQNLGASRPTLAGFRRALTREAIVSLLLGLACGAIVGGIVFAWRGERTAALVVGGGVALSLLCACVLGVAVPTLVHALRLDPKIAAGPVTLALADLCTLGFYFGLARVAL